MAKNPKSLCRTAIHDGCSYFDVTTNKLQHGADSESKPGAEASLKGENGLVKSPL